MTESKWKKRMSFFVSIMQKKVLFKIFIIFNILIIIPITLTNAVNYTYSDNAFEAEVIKSNTTMLRNMIYYIDEKFNKLKNDISIFSSSGNFTKLLHYENADNIIWSDFLDIESDLLKLKKSQSIIHQVLIYFKSVDILVSEMGLDSFKNYYFEKDNSTIWNNILNSESNFNILPTNSIKTYNVFENQTNKLITIYSSFPYFHKPKATLIVFIDSDCIKDIISSYNNVIENNYLILDEIGNVITDYGLMNLLKKNEVDDLIKNINSNKNNFHYKVRNGSFFITYEKSPLTGWVFLSAVPSRAISNKSSHIKNTAFIICLAFIIMGLFISIWLSRRIYRPISTLVNFLDKAEGQNKGIVKKGNINEFSYIKNKLNQIYNANTRLKKSFEAGLPFLCENLFYRIIKGNIKSKVEIFNEFKKYGIKLDGNSFIVVSVRIDLLDYIKSEDYTSEFFDVRSKIKNIIHTMIKGSFNCFSVDMDIKNTAFIVCHNNLSQELILKNCKMVKEFFDSDEYNIVLSMGIGYKCTKLSNIKRSFEESVRAINFRIFNQNNQVVLYDSSFMNQHEMLLYKHNSDLMSITNYLFNGEYERAVKLAYKILDKCVTNKYPYKSVKKLTKLIVDTLISFIEVKKATIGEIAIDEEYAYKSIDLFTNMEDYKKHIFGIYMKVGSFIKEKSSSKKENFVKFVMEYISKNYKSDLSLNVVASELGLSTNYLSHFFKKMVGVSFVDYLGRVRIEKAKQLLKTTNKAVFKISNEVGFAHIHTFNRTFKKFESITPGRYREIEWYRRKNSSNG